MSKELKRNLGRRIAGLRQDKKLSQARLAELLGLSVHGLSVIETGQGFVKSETLEKILDFFNLEPEEFFNFGGTKSVEQLLKDNNRLISNIKSNREKLLILNTFLKSLQ